MFPWILIQNKVLTADNLARRGWPHQTSCILCNGPLETGPHLCLTCPFAQVVWAQVLTGENLSTFVNAPPAQAGDIGEWWEATTRLLPKDRRRQVNGLIIYVMWNIWKERNQRIFDHQFLTAHQVAIRTRENLAEYRQAFRTNT